MPPNSDGHERLLVFSRLSLLAIAALVAWSVPFPSAADETDFVLVDRMPKATGTVVERVSNHDPARGISFRKTVYEERLDGFVVRAYHVELFCGIAVPTDRRHPSIVAFKHIPITPQSFSATTLNDVFSETYVRDQRGDIRAYRGLHASAMERMTDRIAPACRST